MLMTDKSVYYGDTEEYGMSVYLNNQMAKPNSSDLYKEVLASLIEYGTAMEVYVTR